MYADFKRNFVTASSCIRSPKQNDVFTAGVINITGIALATNFTSYEVSIAEGEKPQKWLQIHYSNQEIDNGVLTVLDIDSFTNTNYYWIKLTVHNFDNLVYF